MSKILITGAGGFIGSHLVEESLERGNEVVAFVRYNSRNNWGWLDELPPSDKLKIVTGDIRDFDSVTSAMEGCDTVFHLAALIGIPYSYVSPLAYIRTNIEGTYNILEASRKMKIDNICITSTSETYGSAQYVPIDEIHPMVGQSPYSASKIAADQLGISYYRSFGMPVKIVRPFNTYGPRQSARAIIPTVISQLLNGFSEIRLGNLSPTRDLNFVKDTVKGFFAILHNSAFAGEIVNIGSNSEISVKDLITMITDILDLKVNIITDEQRVRPEKSEVDRLFCDNSKLVNNTDWRSETSLRSGLEQTIDWIRDNLDQYKAGLYNV